MKEIPQGASNMEEKKEKRKQSAYFYILNHFKKIQKKEI